MSLRRYPSYKDSGIEWLGEVPSHWIVAPLKRGFSVALGKMLQPERKAANDILMPYIRAANIHWSGVDMTDVKRMWFSAAELESLRLLPGDLLVSEGGDVGRSCLWAGELDDCYFQNSVNRVRPLGRNTNAFLRYWISALKDKGFIDVLCNKSTIAHFTAEKVQTVPVPLPPTEEQPAIAAFLDRETGKIDALVAEQEKLIELLKEKRQAVISHAVTKGLDPSVPMKDSGIEWLGEVPAHWEVGSLKRWWEVIDCKHVTPQFVDEGIPLASIREVQGHYVDLSAAKQTTDVFYAEMIEGGRRPAAGDLIFSRNATVGEVAQVADWHPLFAMGQDVCLIRKRERELSSDFLQAVVRSNVVLDQLSRLMIGSTFKRVNVEEIRNLVISMPPVEEQTSIANYLAGETGAMEAIVREAQRAIDLLKEHRSALISAAVTGKIDVRGLVDAKPPTRELEPA